MVRSEKDRIAIYFPAYLGSGAKMGVVMRDILFPFSGRVPFVLRTLVKKFLHTTYRLYIDICAWKNKYILYRSYFYAQYYSIEAPSQTEISVFTFLD